jgi:hypothetical protein
MSPGRKRDRYADGNVTKGELSAAQSEAAKVLIAAAEAYPAAAFRTFEDSYDKQPRRPLRRFSHGLPRGLKHLPLNRRRSEQRFRRVAATTYVASTCADIKPDGLYDWASVGFTARTRGNHDPSFPGRKLQEHSQS